MVPQEFLAELNILVGKRPSAGRGRLFMLPGFHQVDTVQRTIHGHFALRAAANRADVAAHARTVTARLTCVADFAFHDGRTGHFHRSIGRAKVYLESTPLFCAVFGSTPAALCLPRSSPNFGCFEVPSTLILR